MIENGLLEEAKNLDELRKYEEGRNLASLNTVAIRSFSNILMKNGILILRFLRLRKTQDRFAKRQLTWYRKEENIHYIEAGYLKRILMG